MRFRAFIVALAVLAAIGSAAAEERMGVVVYPGAKYDADTSRAVKDMLKGEVACFTTSDAVPKVAAFYQSKGLKPVGDVTKEAAMFKKGGIDVTIQSPWMNMKTGALMKDTLVSIVRMPD